MALKALIFDCDGTLAETEEAHRAAFNLAFADAGLDWHWSVDLYRELLKVTGGRERIAHYVAREQLPEVDLAAIHAQKNAIYARLVQSGQVALRPGIMRVMTEAKALGLAFAIATTTSRNNLDSLISASELQSIKFLAIVCGEDVKRKKPDPEAYRVALDQLSFLPNECLAFEDSRNGLLAARAAGIATIITPSFYSDQEEFSEAMMVMPNLHHLSLGSLI
jgi:HAD superfamily hydrolase (TIGR01509 family)